jgi:hypothetical protein
MPGFAEVATVAIDFIRQDLYTLSEQSSDEWF